MYNIVRFWYAGKYYPQYTTKGRLDPGCDADLVLFDEEMNVKEVWYGASRVI